VRCLFGITKSRNLRLVSSKNSLKTSTDPNECAIKVGIAHLLMMVLPNANLDVLARSHQV
jgi:hypothetical protein